MSNIAISVEHISKCYQLGQINTGTFSYDLEVWLAKLRGKPNPMLRIGETDHGNRDGAELWALRDVSFNVEQGEVLGIIGRNGAGKSTLLKILSRVTAPTSGLVKVKGRIASLLEVGTGFHPELSGRENIYLNGAILGMTKAEILRKFDEVVEFAEIEKFIDTPVKRYSSGMYVRLAFAVAAHLEPEILIVDEVLAVGDAEFQKKCLGKMGDVAKLGRTVIFVSHNILQIRNLCIETLFLNNGIVSEKGPTSTVISNYLKLTSQIDITDNSNDPKDGFLSWKILGNSENYEHIITSDNPFTIELMVKDNQKVFNGSLLLFLQNCESQIIAGWHKTGLKMEPGMHYFNFYFPQFPVRSDIYYWKAILWDGSRHIDSKILEPEMVISTIDFSNLDKNISGVLNLPCQFNIV